MSISFTVRKIVNFVLFQLAWFGAVLGAAHGRPALGSMSVLLAFALHLALAPCRRSEAIIALVSAGFGFVFDTLMTLFGITAPLPFLFAPPFSPPWMVLLWVNFSTTMNLSLRSLRGKHAVLAVLGAVGGPAAYYSGVRLGALSIPGPVERNLLILSAGWALTVPILFWIAARIEARLSGACGTGSGRPTTPGRS